MKRLIRLRPASVSATTTAPDSRWRKYVSGLALGIACWVATLAHASARTHRLTSDEMVLFKRISSSSVQQRVSITLDPILCLVARQRAADMAKRNYFSHTNPDGDGPNFLVRREGYVLPTYYDASRSGNNIESLGMGTGGAGEIFSLWLGSAAHRTHVLGEAAFYREQRSIGVGVFRSSRPPFYKYFVMLSAPPTSAPGPQVVTLTSPKGTVMAGPLPRAKASARFSGAVTLP